MNSQRMSRRQFLKGAAGAGSLALVGSVLAACGGAAPAQSTAEPAVQPTVGSTAQATAPAATGNAPVKLLMANFGATPKGWEELGAKFTEENPNITVEFQAVQANSWGDYFDKLVTQIAAGSPPDIVRVAIEGVQLFAHRGLVLPIDDYIERDKADLDSYFSDVHPSMVQSMSYLGKQYQLPFTWNGPVIHYNTKLFAEAGIERPAEDWSVEDFLAIAKQLTKDDVYGFGLGNAFWGTAIPWMYVAGGSVLNDEWTESRTNSPEAIESVQFLQDLIWKHKVSPDPASADLNQMFIGGQLAMIGTGGGNQRLTFINGGLNDFDVLYFPKWRTQQHEYGGTGFPILKSSKYPDEAWQLVKFLLRKESVAYFVNSVAQTPALRSVAYTEWVAPNTPPDHFKVYYDMLDKPAKPVPAPPEYNEVESIFLRYLSLVTANEQDAKTAMDAAHEELSQVLANRTPPAA